MYKWLLVLCFSMLSPQVYASADIYQETLDNGMQVILKQDHRAPVVVAQVWYKVGSSYEPTGLTGISHVLEHMMFKGTTQYPEGEYSRLIADIGGQENAFTMSDATAYYATVAKQHLAKILELEADRMMNIKLDQDSFAKEMSVIKEERRMRVDDNPKALTRERTQASAFISSGYHHPVIGWMKDLEHLKLKQVRAWYDRWYAPNNAILVVVGDVSPEELSKLAKRYFGDLQPSDISADYANTDEKPLGERSVKVHAPAKLPWFVMSYNTPSYLTTKNKEHVFALEMLAGVLDIGKSSRLSTSLVREQQVASSIGVSYGPYSRLADLFTISATPSASHSIAQLRQAIETEIKKLQTELVTEEELQRVKAHVLADKFYTEDSMFYQAYILGSLVVVGLPWTEYDNYIEQVKQVTPEQIKKVANKYLQTKRLTIGELVPQE